MRDIRKNQEYFKSYLEYQYSCIEEKTAKLQQSDEEKRQRILLSLTRFEVDLLKAEFSNGCSKGSLKILLTRAIEIAIEYRKITHEQLMILCSLAIMLGAEDEAVRLIDVNEETMRSDRLLFLLATYIKNEEIEWNEQLPLANEYFKLNEVFSAPDKEEAMISYLNDWYDKHSEYAWYNSHMRDTDTYCGYWSFESAAITKILGLEENKISESEFYPKL
jgi:hypothetical protein